MTTRRTLGPFNRVEGDLQVTLEIAHDKITAAYVNSPMYRGFEQILQGKHPLDALVFVPRICGICSVAQSAAAARALAQAMEIETSRNGQLAAELTLATENIADHLSHFYLFFMPDFAREAYRGKSWFDQAHARFKAITGSAAADALPARAKLMNLMGYLAGKWPHTLSLQPGGSARALEEAEILRMSMLLAEFRGFLERIVFGDSLEALTAINTEAALQQWMLTHHGDFAQFLQIAYDLDLHKIGRGVDHFMSHGSYDGLLTSGVWQGSNTPLAVSTIAEHTAYSWLEGDQPLHPTQGHTQPLLDKEGAYTWCKAPRLNNNVVEVGALARQMVAGQPLLNDLVTHHGGSVMARVVARMIEIAQVLPAMQQWLKAIQLGASFCMPSVELQQGSGVGLVEAARGSLGHWLIVEKGGLVNYQIIAPTTWNFSPRDAAGVPGPLEQALVGLPAEDLLVQHVVRSYDPCMVCTVH